MDEICLKRSHHSPKLFVSDCVKIQTVVPFETIDGKKFQRNQRLLVGDKLTLDNQQVLSRIASLYNTFCQTIYSSFSI
jgi:hypothetical protein